MVEQYCEVTQQLIRLFKNATLENLLEITEESEKLFRQRESIIQQLTGEPTGAQKEFFESKIIPLERELNELLQKNRLETAKELRSIQVGKKTHDAYQSMYDVETTDGIFYDKRK